MQALTSLYNKSVVAVDCADVVATVSGVIISPDCLSVAGYLVVGNGRTGYIPAQIPISVGEGFIVLERISDIVAAAPLHEDNLVGTPACTLLGEKLPSIANWLVDTVSTQIESFILADGQAFDRRQVVAVSRDMLVVDRADLAGVPGRSLSNVEAYQRIVAQRQELAGAQDVQPEEEATSPASLDFTSPENSDSERELLDYLVGKELARPVASADGDFRIKEGAVLTPKLVQSAFEHDCLFQLVANVADAEVQPA